MSLQGQHCRSVFEAFVREPHRGRLPWWGRACRRGRGGGGPENARLESGTRASTTGQRLGDPPLRLTKGTPELPDPQRTQTSKTNACRMQWA